MKMKIPLLFVLISLVSCNQQVVGRTTGLEGSYLGKPIIEFNGEDQDLYRISNGYSNGGMFISKWSKEAIKIEDGVASLLLYDKENVNYGAELRTHQGYLYGYFGARMKVFKKAGTVQSVFTYNGGWVEHDEIDIEFLGKDTTKVQFNFYDNGVGNHEYLYDLGFDASEDFHDYGFKWEESMITWYVDFKPVYQVDARLEQWGNFFINVWAGNPTNPTIVNWLGEYKMDDEIHITQYQYLSYAPLEE